MAGKWSGDVDLNSGDLQRSYEQYKSKLAITSGVGLGCRQGRAIVKDDLGTILTQLQSDKPFIVDGMLYSTVTYWMTSDSVYFFIMACSVHAFVHPCTMYI